jgi:hypothetical protein
METENEMCDCDNDGVYHMWYGDRTDLVEFEDVEVLE